MITLSHAFWAEPSIQSRCVLGVCACVQEQDVLKNLVVPCEVDPLPVREVEIDEFDVKYTANEGGGHIQNDTITLNYRLSGMHVHPGFRCNVIPSKGVNADHWNL